MVDLSPEGQVSQRVLGSDLASGESPHLMVPADHWFGAFPNPGTEYSLVGVTVAPAFDFADFTLAKKETLLAEFPHAKEIIEKLT